MRSIGSCLSGYLATLPGNICLVTPGNTQGTLHHASHSAHPSHAAHSAAAGHGRGVLLDLGDDGLGGREQGGHAGRVGDGAADHLQK